MIDNDSFYEYADIVFEYLVEQIVKAFNGLKSNLVSFDELNVFTSVNKVYTDLKVISYDKFLELIIAQYERATEDEDYSDDDSLQYWLDEILDTVDDITKYIYNNELDRKKARCYESILVGEAVNDSIDLAARHYTRMVHQMLITLTDKITEKAYIDMGLLEVKWVTEKDGSVCHICKERDGNIYPINQVPSKPHIGCRCIEVPV